jgi:hypothetical protein
MLHRRDLKGTVRLFRANTIKNDGNDLVEGFDAENISTVAQDVCTSKAPTPVPG